MHQISDQQYEQFTPEERTRLTFAALARNDETEANRLWETCPRHSYKAHDFEYTLRIDAIILLGTLFFQKCVIHYNRIKKAKEYILGLEDDLKYEKKLKYIELAEQTQKLIALTHKAREVNISQLKAVYDGFNQFCSQVELNSEDVLKTIPIKDACFEIDYFLSSGIEMDKEYAQRIKELFLECWSF